MNRQVKHRILWKWTKGLITQLTLYGLAIAILSLVSYVVLHQRVWKKEDLGYPILHAIDDNWFSFFLGALVIGCLFITVLNFYQIAKALEKITQAVGHLQEEHPAEITLPGDWGEIENQLNEIRRNVERNKERAREAEQQKNDMVMYMAHDLKTPLTSVIGYLTLLRDEPELPAGTREKYTGIALNSAQRLEELLNEFFEITRYNFSHMVLNLTRVNMSVMVEQMLYEFKPVFQQKGLDFEFVSQPEIFVQCDVERMERVFDNLLKNVLNYSFPNTKILVRLEQQSLAGMILVVENQGKTIPKEKLEGIFDQFFRLDSSRDSKTGGTGLGLAVVKEIVQLHKGTVACESENERIRFIVRIP